MGTRANCERERESERERERESNIEREKEKSVMDGYLIINERE